MDQNNNNQYQQQPQQDQQQPNYGYQQQPQYQPPQYQPPYGGGGFNPEATPKFINNLGKGGGWIGFVRVCVWIMFALIELAVVIGGFWMIIQGFSNMRWGGGGLVLVGFMVLIFGTFFAFLAVASMMITLDQAKNIQRIANSTAETNSKIDDVIAKMN